MRQASTESYTSAHSICSSHAIAAHNIVSAEGKQLVLDYLLGEIERLQGRVVFVFSGPRKEMMALFGSSP